MTLPARNNLITFSLKALLKDFISELKSDSVLEYEDVQIKGLAYDSRLVNAGDLFFACDGENIHGKKYIPSVVKAGAVAIALEVDENNVAETNWLSEEYQLPVIPVQNLTEKLGYIAARFYGEPTSTLSLIGITGTNGKTSISHLLAQCLNEPSQPCGVIGTMGAGLWGNLQAVKNTTPGAVELQQWFYDLNIKQTKYVAMEVSSHGLEQGRTNGCDFDLAVFTNLTQDHLDYHGDMKSYGQAKLKLFSHDGHGEKLKAAVLNLDDEFSAEIINTLNRNEKNTALVGVTLNESKLEFGSNIDIVFGRVEETNHNGMKIYIKSSMGSGVVSTSLLGDFNVSNLLTVFACAMSLGFGFDEICKKLEIMQAPIGRLEKFGGDQQSLVVVDYAHTPDALEKALTTLKKHTDGKLLVLMGCGGDRDASKRPEMGGVAEKNADVVWITNDNPRTENPQKIINDILKGIRVVKNVHVEPDRATAIKGIIALADVKDVVLIAGKGHEDYQIMGNQRLHFSDREIVAALVGEAA